MPVVRCFASALVIAAAFLLGACASTGAVPRPFPGATLPPVTEPTVAGGTTSQPAGSTAEPGRANEPGVLSASAPAVVRTALALRGTPYRNGGSDPGGFDCSGFVQWTFNQHGVRLPREVRDQFRVGQMVDLGHIEPGDLLFFETVSRGASHVGIAIGDGQFVHAPSSRGVVRVERFGSEYWASRFIAARRIGTPAMTAN
jgi:cell wall-associated NlpC family hydrolase